MSTRDDENNHRATTLTNYRTRPPLLLLLTGMRADHAGSMQSGLEKKIEARRHRWVNDGNLLTWHIGWEKCLVEEGFADWNDHHSLL